MMRRLGGITLLVLALVLLSGCSAPYEDDDFQKAIAGIDHVAETSGGCKNVDLGWKCDTTVNMGPDASADDIVEVIEATSTLLRENGNDSSTITVNDNGDGPTRGATLEFSKPVKGREDLAAAMQDAATDDAVQSARFDQGSDGVAISLTTKDDQLAPLARAGEQLLSESGADSITARTENGDFWIDARKAAWPTAEVGVLAAVSKRYSVEKARAKKGFLSIAGIMDPSDEVRAFAKSQPGYDTIDFVDITFDAVSDLSNALPADLAAVGAITNELRAQAGFRSVFAAKGRLNVKVRSTDTIEAMDRVLTRKFAAEYAGMDIAYEVEDQLDLERDAGQDLWFETAKSLTDSGLFGQIRIGNNTPDGKKRAIDVFGNEGVGPDELARTVAEAWKPDQAARIKLTYRSSTGQDTAWFTAAEAITIDESNRLPKEQADLIVQGWAEGRAAK